MMNVNRLANLSFLKNPSRWNYESALRLKDSPSQRHRTSLVDETSTSKVRSILVPLDGSVFAEQAIPLALAIAEESGAVLSLVHVMVPVEVIDPYTALYSADATLKSLKRDKYRYLEEVSYKVAAASTALIATRVIDGRAVSQSLDEMGNLNADLVVTATHGRGPFGRFWTGSVAHSLLQKNSVPVVLVRGSDEPVTFAANTIDHILLPLPSSEKTMRQVLDLGIFRAARHSLLHAVPLVPKHEVKGYALRTDWVPSRHRWLAGRQYLEPLARLLKSDGRNGHTKVVSSDEPFGQVIVRHAEQDEVGLIAMAYDRQSPFARLIWPNTSEYLFQHSSRPIMFVPLN